MPRRSIKNTLVKPFRPLKQSLMPHKERGISSTDAAFIAIEASPSRSSIISTCTTAANDSTSTFDSDGPATPGTPARELAPVRPCTPDNWPLAAIDAETRQKLELQRPPGVGDWWYYAQHLLLSPTDKSLRQRCVSEPVKASTGLESPHVTMTVNRSPTSTCTSGSTVLGIPQISIASPSQRNSFRESVRSHVPSTPEVLSNASVSIGALSDITERSEYFPPVLSPSHLAISTEWQTIEQSPSLAQIVSSRLDSWQDLSRETHAKYKHLSPPTPEPTLNRRRSCPEVLGKMLPGVQSAPNGPIIHRRRSSLLSIPFSSTKQPTVTVERRKSSATEYRKSRAHSHSKEVEPSPASPVLTSHRGSFFQHRRSSSTSVSSSRRSSITDNPEGLWPPPAMLFAPILEPLSPRLPVAPPRRSSRRTSQLISEPISTEGGLFISTSPEEPPSMEEPEESKGRRNKCHPVLEIVEEEQEDNIDGRVKPWVVTVPSRWIRDSDIPSPLLP